MRLRWRMALPSIGSCVLSWFAMSAATHASDKYLWLVAKPPGVLRSVPTFLKISHILDIYNIIQDFTTKAELIMILTTRVWQHVSLAPCDAENDTIHPLQHPGHQYWSWNIGYDISDRNDENSAGNWDFITVVTNVHFQFHDCCRREIEFARTKSAKIFLYSNAAQLWLSSLICIPIHWYFYLFTLVLYPTPPDSSVDRTWVYKFFRRFSPGKFNLPSATIVKLKMHVGY